MPAAHALLCCCPCGSSGVPFAHWCATRSTQRSACGRPHTPELQPMWTCRHRSRPCCICRWCSSCQSFVTQRSLQLLSTSPP